jgi:hypothetical protein
MGRHDANVRVLDTMGSFLVLFTVCFASLAQLTGFATSAGVQLSALLPAAWEELAPMIALDNMAAM